MPSILGHAILGGAAAQLTGQKHFFKRLLALSLACSILPDIDILSFHLGIPYDSFWGHRGFSHSIVFAFVFGILSACVFQKTKKLKTLSQWKWALYFFLITLSHPILDAMTTGGHGVALFLPFNSHRYFFNHRAIHVSPLFLSGLLDFVGLRILFIEVVCILIPCLIAVLIKRVFFHNRQKQTAFAPFLIFFLSIGFFLKMSLIREELVPESNGIDIRKIEAPLMAHKNNKEGIGSIPLDDLPGKRLVTNYNELLTRNLLNATLKPRNSPWSSSSFPFWMGGAAGRWQEPYALQIWKVLMGQSFMPKSDLLGLLHRSQSAVPDQQSAISRLEKLAPTEKYDLAVSDYYLNTTRIESALRGAGSLDRFPHTPFWSGYCSWLSLAAIYEKEPKHPVEVVNADGYKVKFLPEDLKALLGISYLFISPQNWAIGTRCDLDGPKSEACIDVDPAELVIAVTNLIGLAKTSFLIDKEPFSEIQSAPIRSAEVKVINPPYFVSERPSFFTVNTTIIKWLMDVEIILRVSKITAFQSSSNEETLTYRATLGLDSKMNLAGGRWEDPFNHPDFAWGGLSTQTQPAVVDHSVLANQMEWPFVKKLVEESEKDLPPTEALQASKITHDPIYHGLFFEAAPLGVSGKVAYRRAADPIEVYGYIEGKALHEFASIELLSIGSEKTDRSDVSLAIEHFLVKPGESRHFFKLKTPGSIENLETVILRLNKLANQRDRTPLQVVIPPKKSFKRLSE